MEMIKFNWLSNDPDEYKKHEYKKLWVRCTKSLGDVHGYYSLFKVGELYNVYVVDGAKFGWTKKYGWEFIGEWFKDHFEVLNYPY